MNLYELVTTENVDLNYKVFKKDELIDCISNLSDTYFRLKKENEEVEQLKEVIDKAIEYIRSNDIEVLKYHDIPSETTSYEIVTVDLLKILKEVE